MKPFKYTHTYTHTHTYIHTYRLTTINDLWKLCSSQKCKDGGHGSSVLFSPEPYLDKVNICVRVTFTLSETFTNKSTNAVFKKGTAVFRAEDPVRVNRSSYCFHISLFENLDPSTFVKLEKIEKEMWFYPLIPHLHKMSD